MKHGWEIKKLGEVCEVICGQDYKQVKNDNGKYPIYGTGGIMGYASQFKCPANSVIIGRKGSINNPLFIKEKFWNVDTAFGVAPNTSLLVPKFFYYFCKNYDFTKHDVSVTIPSLRRTDIIKISIPIPPLSIQSKIVSELDGINGILEKKREQIKELDALAQSIFYDMFGDPIQNEKGWEVKKLGDVAVLKAGKSIKANELSESYSDGLYPCYGGNGIRGYIQKKSHEGTLPIIGRQGALCGNVVLARNEFYATEHAVVCNPIISINNIWFYWALLFCNLNRFAQGVAQPGISVGVINEMLLPLPPLPLQQAFAAKIEAIEKQKELVKRSIAEVETLLASRMQHYFEA